MQIEAFVDISDRHAAVENISAVGLFRNLLIDFFVVFVGNIADDLFQKVFERDDALDTAVFVNDETEVKFFLLHLAQNVFEPRRINDVIRLFQNPVEFEHSRFDEQILHHVFAVQNAAHIVERFAVNRQTRIAVFAEGFGDLI